MVSLGTFLFLVGAIPMVFILYVLKRFYDLYDVEIVPRRRVGGRYEDS